MSVVETSCRNIADKWIAKWEVERDERINEVTRNAIALQIVEEGKRESMIPSLGDVWDGFARNMRLSAERAHFLARRIVVIDSAANLHYWNKIGSFEAYGVIKNEEDNFGQVRIEKFWETKYSGGRTLVGSVNGEEVTDPIKLCKLWEYGSQTMALVSTDASSHSQQLGQH